MSFFKKIIKAFTNTQEKILIEPKKINTSVKNNKPSEESPRLMDDRNLNSVEILMLNYADGLLTSTTSFPGYWEYQYKASPKNLLKKLLDKGFIEKDNSLKNNMKRAIIKDLKHVLKENQLKVSGNKDELIERLIQNVPGDILKKIFNREIYILTDKGNQIIKENDHIKFFHSYSNLGIPISIAHEIKKKRPELSKYDIAWQQLNISSMEHVKKGDWGLYRNDKLNMATILTLENKLSRSLLLLFEVCYYDLSGLSNNFNLDYLDIYEKRFYEKSSHTLAPGVVNQIISIKEQLNLNDDEFKKKYLDFIINTKTLIHLFTKEEVFDIIFYEMHSDKNSVQKVYITAQKRFKSDKLSITYNN